jgi:uncharacterized protein
MSPTDSSGAAIGTIALRLRPNVEPEFSTWQARMAMTAARCPGFINAEVNAPAADAANRAQWDSVVRFRTAGDLHAWRNSAEYRKLLHEARSLVAADDPAALREEELRQTDGAEGGTVCEVVTTHVKIGKELEYGRWAERIHRVESQFPGYRGWLLQPPVSQRERYWTTLVRFATAEQLEAWLDSDERRKLLREHAALVESWEHHRLPSSFAGWFPNDSATGASPAAWKQSMLVILVLFPIVMLEVRFLRPLLSELNPSPATFVGNVVSVALLAWPFMPLMIGRMNWWLSPRKDGPGWVNPAGLLLLIALYAVEIAIFSRFA